MGLINVPAIANLAAATPELFNSRFSTITDVINGNLDADNLENGAVTAPKLATDAVLTAKIADAQVTPNKLNLAPAAAYVSTEQTTTSTSYTDLTTTTDTVTVTIGENGLALLIITSNSYAEAAGAIAYISFAASGTNTLAADDSRAIVNKGAGSEEQAQSVGILLTELDPGATTFKMKYRVNSSTGHFYHRRIAVIPL